MRIKQLAIKHYKSVEEEIIFTNFQHINIFIGPNNSGKTNIFDAIESLLKTELDPIRYDDEKCDMSLEIETRNKDIITIGKKSNKKTYKINNQKSVSAKLPQNISAQTVRISYEATEEDFDFKNDLTGFKNKYPSEYSGFIKKISDYFPYMEINEQLFVAEVMMDRKDRPVERMGKGFFRLFLMLFYIFHPDYNIILIEEPSAHLHPSIIKKLARLLEDAHLNNQVFITTHCSLFVQPYNLHHVFRVKRSANRNTKVYSLDRAHSHLDKKRLVQELDADNTQMFFAEKVLIVEGISDRIFFRGMIDRFYKKDKDIKVIHSAGKGNVDIYMDLCDAFHLPYIVLLDKDAIRGSASWRVSSVLRKGMNKNKKIRVLKEHNIYVFPNGTLERNYPRKYQKRGNTKPLNALYAVSRITQQDYLSPEMAYVREVIAAL